MKYDELKGKFDKDKIKGALTQENLSKKGTIVAIIAAIMIFGAILGSLGNKKKVAVTKDHNAVATHEKAAVQTEKKHETATVTKKHEKAEVRKFKVVEKKEKTTAEQHAKVEKKHEKTVVTKAEGEKEHAQVEKKQQDVVVKHVKAAEKPEKAAEQHAKVEKAQKQTEVKYTYVDKDHAKVAKKQPQKLAVVPVKKVDTKTRQELEDLRRAKEQLQAELSSAKAAAKKMEQKNKALALAAPKVVAPSILPIEKIQELLASQRKMIKELRQKEKALKGHLLKREKNVLELSKVIKTTPAEAEEKAPEKVQNIKSTEKTTIKKETAVKEAPAKKATEGHEVKAKQPAQEQAVEKVHEEKKVEAPKHEVKTPPVAEKHADDTHEKDNAKSHEAPKKH